MKKILLLFLVILTLSISLSACAGFDLDEDGSSQVQNPSEEPQEPQEPEPDIPDEIILDEAFVEEYENRSYYMAALTNSNFASIEERFEWDSGYTDKGENLNLLVSANSKNGAYTVYVNRYSGIVYYVNNENGQILSSNSVLSPDVDIQAQRREKLLQFQVIVAEGPYVVYLDSFNQNVLLSVTEIEDGLKVEYSFGWEQGRRFLLPARLTAKSFHDNIMKPMLTSFEELFLEAMTEAGKVEDANNFIAKNPFDNLKYRYNHGELKGIADEYILNHARVEAYMDDAISICARNGVLAEYTDVMKYMRFAAVNLYQNYTVQNPQLNDYYKGANGELTNPKAIEDMYKKYPICETTPIYVFNEDVFNENQIMRFHRFSSYIKKYCPQYTMERLCKDEEECGYVFVEHKPYINCSLEYTFNADGSLNVKMPESSIKFDDREGSWILNDIVSVSDFKVGETVSFSK